MLHGLVCVSVYGKLFPDKCISHFRELIHLLGFDHILAVQNAKNTFPSSGPGTAFFCSEAGFLSREKKKSQNTWRRESHWLSLKLELLILYKVQTDP